jgi:hypothetical protein
VRHKRTKTQRRRVSVTDLSGLVSAGVEVP